MTREAEEVIVFNDAVTTLHAIVIVDKTSTGPALGTTRRATFESPMHAMTEALQRAKENSLIFEQLGKAFGGSAAVIIDNPELDSVTRKHQLIRFGRSVERLAGLFKICPDHDLQQQDLEHAATKTQYVFGATDQQFALFQQIREQTRLACLDKLGLLSDEPQRFLFIGASESHIAIADKLREQGHQVTFFGSELTSIDSEEVVEELADLNSYAAILLDSHGFDFNADNIKAFSNCTLLGSTQNQLNSVETDQQLHNQGCVTIPGFLLNAAALLASAHEQDSTDAQDKAAIIDDVINDIINEVAEHVASLAQQSKSQSKSILALCNRE